MHKHIWPSLTRQSDVNNKQLMKGADQGAVCMCKACSDPLDPVQWVNTVLNNHIRPSWPNMNIFEPTKHSLVSLLSMVWWGGLGWLAPCSLYTKSNDILESWHSVDSTLWKKNPLKLGLRVCTANSVAYCVKLWENAYHNDKHFLTTFALFIPYRMVFQFQLKTCSISSRK